ncbi:MAG: rRNA adenine dimethyltransferase family protein [Anaerolineales bacterium]|nr:rRNA adenine dimethyltransferase family protein [Anaerolineales bacterium]
MPPQRELKHSQNFIRQPRIVVELLELTNIGSSDLVVEIGPGKGMITQELLKRAGRVIAVERDPQLAKELSLLNTQGNLTLVVGDFMEWELPSGEYKVFSNPPFNYTADIVSKLTSSKRMPVDMYLFMQEAAAHRFAGVPYEKNSQISILLSIDFQVEILRKISSNYFEPRPNVTIVFVHFAKRAAPLLAKGDRQYFRDFVVYGYNQWAPTVIDAFKNIFSKKQWSIIIRTLDLTGKKPTELTFEQWIELFGVFKRFVNKAKKSQVYGSEARLKKTQEKLTKIYRTRKPGE